MKQMIQKLQRLVTTKELAELTGLSTRYICRLADAGDIPNYRPHPNGRYRFDFDEVKEWMRSNARIQNQ